MLPLVTYEMVRQLNEERRARSLKRFWWRYVQPEPTVTVPQSVQVADVIEWVFGAHCETEESIGA